jgi:hypothetical protein
MVPRSAMLPALFFFSSALILSAGSEPFDCSAQTERSAGTGTIAQTHIDCVSPDGRASRLTTSSASEPGATALIMDDGTITCLLQEGETNFVVEMPRTGAADRLTFLNENASARGEIRIAVSNRKLSANSPGWSEVEGIVPFAHKRLFGVSLVGIEAKYIRVSFRVEKEGKVSSRATHDVQQTARGRMDFAKSDLDAALNSTFASLYSRAAEPLLSFNSDSVGPLSAAPRN